MNVRRSRVLLALLLPLLTGCNAYAVALFGDVPYSESNEAVYDRMIDDINEDGVAFSSHVGDFKAGDTPCTDAQVHENVARFDRFERPLVFTPGDNEWTDCSEPEVRLGRLRELVYRGSGSRSRGAEPMALASQAQAGYPENARWRRDPITFASLHVVGSNDNYRDRVEHDARRRATIDWMRRAFDVAEARGDRAVVFLAHAGLRFDRPEGEKGAYESMFRAIRARTLRFDGVVMYVHGDTHTFRNDRPMKTAEGATVRNFRRVEVFGHPTVRWVRLAVDAKGGDRLLSVSTPSPP